MRQAVVDMLIRLANVIAPPQVPTVSGLILPPPVHPTHVITHEWLQKLLRVISAKYSDRDFRFTDPQFRPSTNDWLIEAREGDSTTVSFRVTYSFGGLAPCATSDSTDQWVIFHPASSLVDNAKHVGRLLKY